MTTITRSKGPASSLIAVSLIVLLPTLLPNAVCAQAPALLWNTSVGAKLFAVDAQTNAYASVGGQVIVINPAGQPSQTNTICPLPGVAQRDDGGNYYFAGNFDGAQNFGGITLVGGWINGINFDPPQWVAGYPTCFLAKYSAGGTLQWVTAFGAQAMANVLSDVAVDPNGNSYLGYQEQGGWWYGKVARINGAGTLEWITNLFPYGGVIKPGGVTTSNCCVFEYQSSAVPVPDPKITPWLVDSSGAKTLLGQFSMRMRSDSAVNGKPVIDNLGRPMALGQCFDPINDLDGTCTPQLLRKFTLAGAELWSQSVTTNALWILARDPQANVYLAGTNGMFAKYDTDGNFIWSNNFGRTVVAMTVDGSGNRFLSFADGGLARLGNELVAVAPTIVSNPQPVTVFVGDTVSLAVSAAGTEPLRYSWRRNDAPIASAKDRTYTFANAVATQTGEYTVVVTNSVGAVTSTPPALVRVKSVQLYLGSQMLTNGSYAFPSPPTLTIRSAFPNGSMFYTLDGSPPSFASAFYSGPFVVPSNATIRALGYNASFTLSEEADPVNIVVLGNHTLTATTSIGGLLTTNLNWNPYALPCVSLPADAVAWWRGENNPTDFIGGHTGALLNGASYSNGYIGQAFQLNSYGMHIRVPDAADLRLTSAMTAEAWLYYPGSGSGTIIAKWDSVLSRSQSSFRLRVANNPVGSHNAVFAISPDGTGGATTANGAAACVSGPVPTGVWSHLAGTYDGATLRIYVNGALSGQSSYGATIFPGLDDVGIGATVGGETTGGQFDPFTGLLDEVKLYRRALSAAEILAIYQAGPSGNCTETNGPFTGGSFLSINTVTVKAIPQPGNTFLYWLGDVTGYNPVVGLTMERDKVIRAVFGTTLSTTVAGNGQVQLSPPGGVYPYGTTVRLTGIPDPGNYFGFWGNAATGNTNPLPFTITAPTQTVSSIFGATPAGQAALTTLINGSGRVFANPRANAYPLNQLVTLTATPIAGQSFLGWSGDASGAQNPLSLSLTAAKTITANFTARPILSADRPGLDGFFAGQFRFTLAGDPVAVLQIFGSTNLSDWDWLGRVTNYYGQAQFTDPTSAAAPKKFYQASP